MAWAGAALKWTSLAVSTYAGVESANIQGQNMEAQGRTEGTNARNREIERKRNLMSALALQNVRAGASGITSGTGSSAQAIMREDISRKELDTATDVGRTEQRTSQLQQNISTTKTSSLLSAASEVAGGAYRTKKRGSIKAKAER